MVSLDISKLMTFVVMTSVNIAVAAPQQDVQLEIVPEAEEQTVDTNSLSDEKGVIVSTPTEDSDQQKVRYFYPYRQSMSPKLGILLDPDMLRESEVPLALGIRYMLPRRRSPQWEIGFDILTEEGAHVYLGKRFITNPRRPFRPYFTVSGMLSAQAEERLATITDFKNYYVKLGAGFEDIIKLPMSVRIEVEFAVGLERQFAIFNFGYSWGW